jgi:hypothetical protein
MKELIGMTILAASIVAGGSKLASQVHDYIRKEALVKANQGLPSLSKLTRSLRGDERKSVKRHQ